MSQNGIIEPIGNMGVLTRQERHLLPLRIGLTILPLFRGIKIGLMNTGQGRWLAMVVQNKVAKGILATLWRAADENTRQLMREFYRLRKANNLTKAEALRQVQIKLLTDQNQIQSEEPLVLAHRRADIHQGKAASPLGIASFQPDSAKPFAHPTIGRLSSKSGMDCEIMKKCEQIPPNI